MLRAPLLIVVEGIDGSGKTTLVAALKDWISAQGMIVRASKEPTNGPHGSALRASAQGRRLTRDAEMALFIADRREHVTQLIEPALNDSSIVILDRYYFSNAAYQGSNAQEAAQIIASNEAFAPRPDLLLILDLPPATGIGRIRARGDRPNSFELPETLSTAREIFLSFASSHGAKVIDASQNVETVFEASIELIRRS